MNVVVVTGDPKEAGGINGHRINLLVGDGATSKTQVINLYQQDINSAHALNRGHILGSLEEGKLADIVIWNAPNHRHIAYHFGVNLVRSVWRDGVVVAG